MNRILIILIFTVFNILTNLKAADPNFAETSIRYNASTDYFEVFARFDVNGPTSLGMSMISIVLPAECPDVMISCQSYNGGIWVDNSRTFNENGYDYHGFITSGISSFGFLANKEQKLFEFQLPQAKKIPISKVKLWNAKTDVKETLDGTDFRSNFYIAKSGYYLTPEVYETTTAVKDILDFQIEVSPNPAIDFVKIIANLENINVGQSKVEILNMEGKIISKFDWDLQTSKTFDLNISELPASTYRIQVVMNQKSYVASIVKLNK